MHQNKNGAVKQIAAEKKGSADKSESRLTFL